MTPLPKLPSVSQGTQLLKSQAAILAQAVWLQSALLNLDTQHPVPNCLTKTLRGFSNSAHLNFTHLLSTYFYILTTKFTKAKNLEVVPPLPFLCSTRLQAILKTCRSYFGNIDGSDLSPATTLVRVLVFQLSY